MKDRIARALRLLSNPSEGFREMEQRSLEDIVSDYIVLLLFSGLLAGAGSLLLGAGRAAYLGFFRTVQIYYLPMFNYLLGQAVSLLFFYLFAGTFLMFFVSLLARVLVRQIPYTRLLKILLTAAAPIILFSWIPVGQGSLALWCMFLFVLGIRLQRGISTVRKDSIQQRD